MPSPNENGLIEFRHLIRHIETWTKGEVDDRQLEFHLKQSARDVIRELALLRETKTFESVEKNMKAYLRVPGEVSVALTRENGGVYEVDGERVYGIQKTDSAGNPLWDMDGAPQIRLPLEDFVFGRVINMYIGDRSENNRVHGRFSDYVVALGADDPIAPHGAYVDLGEDFYYAYGAYLNRSQSGAVLPPVLRRLDGSVWVDANGNPRRGVQLTGAGGMLLWNDDGTPQVSGSTGGYNLAYPSEAAGGGDKLAITYCFTIGDDAAGLPPKIYREFSELIGWGALTRLPDNFVNGRAGDIMREYEKRLARARSRIEGGIVSYIPTQAIWGDIRERDGFYGRYFS